MDVAAIKSETETCHVLIIQYPVVNRWHVDAAVACEVSFPILELVFMDDGRCRSDGIIFRCRSFDHRGRGFPHRAEIVADSFIVSFVFVHNLVWIAGFQLYLSCIFFLKLLYRLWSSSQLARNNSLFAD